MSTFETCIRCGYESQPVDNIENMHGVNVLHVGLYGGYAQFIDNELEETKEQYGDFSLCHKCGHELMTVFLNIPAEQYRSWHPNSGDDFCCGWKTTDNL